MAMKSLSSRPSVADKNLFLTSHPLSLTRAIKEVEDPTHGAVVTFSGCVRDTEENCSLKAIVYETYSEMAEAELAKLIREAETRWPVKAWVQHRVGSVPVQEASVVIACAGPHRKEAFEACQFIIDQLKVNVPIWKVRYEK